MLGVSFKKLAASWSYAVEGIKRMLKEEQVFKIMFFIAILVTIAMFYFHLALLEKVALFGVIILVLVLELLNSIIEKLLDFVCPNQNGKVRIIKDAMAGIVLLACIGAAIIGILIFLPYLKT